VGLIREIETDKIDIYTIDYQFRIILNEI